MIGVSVNNGSTAGEDLWIIQYKFSKGKFNRPGTKRAAKLILAVQVPQADVQAFITVSDAGNINGSLKLPLLNFLMVIWVIPQNYIIMQLMFTKKSKFVHNYRTPYWRSLQDFPYLLSLFGDGNASSYKGYVLHS
jgi:iron complex outermembrane receptor protein